MGFFVTVSISLITVIFWVTPVYADDYGFQDPIVVEPSYQYQRDLYEQRMREQEYQRRLEEQRRHNEWIRQQQRYNDWLERQNREQQRQYDQWNRRRY